MRTFMIRPIITLALFGLLCMAVEARAESSKTQPDSLIADRTHLPGQGMITYRVALGDSNFEIGRTSNEWKIEKGRYHLKSIARTTGLARLLRPTFVVMESRGRITPEGLRPDTFVVRQGDDPVREWAEFDWKNMKIRVGEQPEQNLKAGSQDLLSFNYNFGFMPDAASAGSLFVTTGKRYRNYPISFVARGEIETPAGKFKTLHLRTSGENTTELWLAYDYWLLPVKIRHVDKRGGSFVQAVTEIRVDSEKKIQGGAD